ncbi:MAG: DUF973 family protein [Saccharolobus sp.]|uniref:DUF973 family protein n=1 Tax=Saccharolobus TaxID=2100760 RepID=UPI001F10EAE6|nr:DUF973 family protein [Saccharolobus shibatae]MCH4816478.1 DUF973 family protein [Saccharolobus shibatae]
MSMGSIDVQALRQLKDSALWFTVIIFLSTIFISVDGFMPLLIVSTILLFMVGLPKLRQAFETFKTAGKDVGYGFTGLEIILVGFVIEVIGSILPIVRLVLVGRVISVFGGILVFIASLLIGIVLYNLGKFYNSELLKVGGIIEIIPVISFIGWILVYVSVDEIVRRLTGGFITYPQRQFGGYGESLSTLQNQSFVEVYQIGIGEMKANGEVKFTLYSSTNIKIVSASLEGTNYTSNSIVPESLNPGNNNVTVIFPPLSGMIPNNNYNLILTLSNGQSVKIIVTYKN